MFHDKLDGFVAGITSKRNSALIFGFPGTPTEF